jgi:hypothetical protein
MICSQNSGTPALIKKKIKVLDFKAKIQSFIKIGPAKKFLEKRVDVALK